MRVIAGSRKRMPLVTPPGMGTRPTTDRIKETLFNMLNPYLYGCRFLDLFAGSGQMGIEALSRGSREAVFVEKSPRAADCIKRNLEFTRLTEQGTILVEDAVKACESGRIGEAFDVIFMDPPYDRQLEKQVLEALSASELLREDGLIVAEASLETDFSYLDSLGFVMERQKQYKTNQHVFIRRG